MALPVSEKLGSYQILAPIRAGGMGEVYRARDTQLDRIVALNVSNREFSDRFEREARGTQTDFRWTPISGPAFRPAR